MARVSDRQLWNWILLSGVVSFFLGKKALEGATVDPTVERLRRAGVL